MSTFSAKKRHAPGVEFLTTILRSGSLHESRWVMKFSWANFPQVGEDAHNDCFIGKSGAPLTCGLR